MALLLIFDPFAVILLLVRVDYLSLAVLFAVFKATFIEAINLVFESKLALAVVGAINEVAHVPTSTPCKSQLALTGHLTLEKGSIINVAVLVVVLPLAMAFACFPFTCI